MHPRFAPLLVVSLWATPAVAQSGSQPYPPATPLPGGSTEVVVNPPPAQPQPPPQPPAYPPAQQQPAYAPPPQQPAYPPTQQPTYAPPPQQPAYTPPPQQPSGTSVIVNPPPQPTYAPPREPRPYAPQSTSSAQRATGGYGQRAQPVVYEEKRPALETVAIDSLYGAAAGFLIGAGVSLLEQGDHWGRNLMIGTGAGIIVGAVVGGVQAVNDSNRVAMDGLGSPHKYPALASVHRVIRFSGEF